MPKMINQRVVHQLEECKKRGMRMKVDTIVTMHNGEEFFIADETFQNNTKYYLGNKVGEDGNPSETTVIFKETIDDDGVYLDIVKDQSIVNYLTAIFLANYCNYLEEQE